ncbi:hypothetical protein MKW94_006231 [Papaver nudicaule]|uniref:Uncharacterized protein n=1 Tax=Papaver nudicaule TaxID=74823 RepID=A0AA42AR31_PAPNU|nr:hypothetical protein [Papaver nudicaule]
MHGRHRNPGNGVRSNAMRMEGSGRVQGMYNNRNFNRGFGRGSPKPFPPPQPPRKTDIFMEAGRLAAEYLVSQGLLHQNVLSEKRENVGFTYQIAEEPGMQERLNLQLSSESRTSALSRLGNTTPDAGFAAFPDEFNSARSSDNGRGRKKDGPFRSNSLDWDRENGNAGSLLEKSRSFSDIKGADDFRSASQDEQQQVGVDASGAGVLVQKSENAGESESKLEKLDFPNDECSNTKKEVLPPETDGENAKGPNDSIVLDMENSKVKNGMENSLEKDETSENETDMEGKTVDNYSLQCHAVGEGEEMSKSSSSLFQLGTFAEVPTKARPTFTWKSADGDPISTTDEENGCDTSPQEGTGIPLEEDTHQVSSSDMLTNQINSSKCLESDLSRPQAVEATEDSVDLDDAYAMEERKMCSVEQSFPGVSFMLQEESGQGYGSCGSSVKDRGEKRAIETDVEKERTKRAREEWSSSMVIDADEYFDSPTFGGLPSISYEERVSGDEDMVKTANQERLVEVNPSVELKEEKPMFSNSFKICDLNLMEANDMTEHHNQDSALVLPTLEVKTEVPDFTPNNNNRSIEYNRHSFNGKEVIIVDLEDDSADENKAFDTSDRKAEGVYSGLSSFQNNTGSTCDVPDVHDGYGLMISELLGTDITNCSSVSTDITGLQTDMGLHNEAGMLCDDDSIYLSLGEIPISFQGVWPEKPFG